jgi:hypothetical protein
MDALDASSWSEQLQRTLSRYDEALLRAVAAKLLKPRNQWPIDELIARSVTTATNPAVLDRRLKELEPAARQLLALIGHSRQPRWAMGNLVEMLIALGHTDGVGPVLALLQTGLLYPYLGEDATASARVKSFEQWLAAPGPAGLTVFTHPIIATRAVGEDFGLPDLSSAELRDGSAVRAASAVLDADGLEWLLRLAVFWQQVAAVPVRKTMQGGFFKRDVDRIGQDALLNGPPSDKLADLPDVGFLMASLAELQGMVRDADGELRAAELPAAWESGLAVAHEAIWVDLPRLRTWTPLDGWRGGEEIAGNPFPSAYLLTFLLLARGTRDAWFRPADLEAWLYEQHPYWASESLRPSRRQSWLASFLLGFAFHLRLVQAMRDGDEWVVRLSPTGRWLLGLADAPPAETAYTRTLLVQPNLEIVAFRQGLSAALIARLSRIAAWKTLGPACTLQLGPETIYRALEAGQTYETICRTLDQHGTRPTPPAVLDLLRTWANKRDRITVYPSATLLEFASAADLNDALARGVPATRLSDTLAVVGDGEGMEFRHFRLTGTRDYALPPERCVTAEEDGVTLAVDLARSDLLLETELPRFAVMLDTAPTGGKRRYRLTPASLVAARESGMTLPVMEAWFQQRTGRPLPASARLLMMASLMSPPVLLHHFVLHIADEELADGVMQWPETAALIQARLGPSALVVAEENLPKLREQLRAAGITIKEDR